MDWQTYVDGNLIAGHCSAGLILDLDGTVLAASPGFALKPGEAQAIVALFKAPSSPPPRILIAGAKYFISSAAASTVTATQNAGGVMLVKSRPAIIVGTCTAPATVNDIAPALLGLANYLNTEAP